MARRVVAPRCLAVETFLLSGLLLVFGLLVVMYSSGPIRERVLMDHHTLRTPTDSQMKTFLMNPNRGEGKEEMPSLLSRRRGVEATCDVRGNLGECSVVIQDPPGNDW